MTLLLRFTCLLLVLLPPTVQADEVDNRLALADTDRGRVLFGACRLCHEVGENAAHRVGPSLQRIFGRVVGSQADFPAYSPGFVAADFVWTPKLMYAWLEAPLAKFPESTMLAPGISDPQDRADLIAYLMRASAGER